MVTLTALDLILEHAQQQPGINIRMQTKFVRLIYNQVHKILLLPISK